MSSTTGSKSWLLLLTLMPGATLFLMGRSLGAVGSLLWLLWHRVGLLGKLTTLFLLLCSPICAQGQSITVTLLGTGSPVPSLERFGPSILVQAGSQVLLGRLRTGCCTAALPAGDA